MIVVSDTSPIIALASVHQLSLLHEQFGEILVPKKVLQEIIAAEASAPGVREVRSSPWIREREVQDQSLVQALSLELDPGESEAIVLASEVQADLLLMDERRGRAVAARLGRSVLGVLAILIRAKAGGQIEAVRPVLDALVQRAGFRVSQELHQRVLVEAGEARE